MGGRKSYPNRKYLGSSKGVKEENKKLSNFIQEKDIKNITKQSFIVFTKAKNPLVYSAYSAKFFPELMKNYSKWKKEKDSDKLRRDVVSSWVKVKQKHSIRVPKEVDRVIIERTINKLRGDSK